MAKPTGYKLVRNIAPNTLFWYRGHIWQKSGQPNSLCASRLDVTDDCLCDFSGNRVGRPLTAEEEAVWRLKSGE